MNGQIILNYAAYLSKKRVPPLHSISMYLLHADSLRHVTDIALPEGKENWQYANRWQSQMDKLKTYGDVAGKDYKEIEVKPGPSGKQKQFKLF